jgi:hypothetical protein
MKWLSVSHLSFSMFLKCIFFLWAGNGIWVIYDHFQGSLRHDPAFGLEWGKCEWTQSFDKFQNNLHSNSIETNRYRYIYYITRKAIIINKNSFDLLLESYVLLVVIGVVVAVCGAFAIGIVILLIYLQRRKNTLHHWNKCLFFSPLFSLIETSKCQ